MATDDLETVTMSSSGGRTWGTSVVRLTPARLLRNRAESRFGGPAVWHRSTGPRSLLLWSVDLSRCL